MAQEILPPPGTSLRPEVREQVAEERVAELLDVPPVLQQLADLCQTPLGKRRALDLRPIRRPRLVEAALQETSQGRLLVDRHQVPGLEGLVDVGPAIGRAARGSVLPVAEIAAIGAAASVLEGVRHFFRQLPAEVAPEVGDLVELGRQVEDFSAVADRVVMSLSPGGEVLDAASPALAASRARARRAEARLRGRLEELLRHWAGEGVLQDAIITQRHGRFVLPVKADSRSQLRGVVHDQSGSGQTVFIEPLEVVGLGNDLRTAEAGVAAEIERVLADLSALCGERPLVWDRALAAAGRLDLAFAKGRLSARWEACAPEVVTGPLCALRQARHPLIASPEPIDLRLGGEYDALVITGPNTGGKTVALKTTGLFAWLGQAGLHLPVAPGSILGPFPRILADVGDEQGVAQSLSTFSAHVTRIVQALRALVPGTLVLLDELGAGTDPQEGSALAMAVLEHLLAAGALVVVTSHFSELKAFAHQHPRARNAAVSFDAETLRPTYHLEVGNPGPSQALAVAERLGMPEAVVVRARELVTPSGREVEALIAGMARERQRLARESEVAASERQRLEGLRADLERERSALRDQAATVLAEARAEAEALVARAEREAEAVLRRLREQLAEARLQEAAAEAEADRTRLAQLRQALGVVPRPAAPVATTFHSGQRVRIQSLGRDGVLLDPPSEDGDARVLVGTLRLTVPRSDLAHIAQAERPEARSGGVWSGAPATADLNCDVRGMRADEALAQIDKFLDDALLSGLREVQIIHGKGTGALRAAVTDFLRGHAEVAEFRLGHAGEGGAGVTVVHLRE